MFFSFYAPFGAVYINFIVSIFQFVVQCAVARLRATDKLAHISPYIIFYPYFNSNSFLIGD